MMRMLISGKAEYFTGTKGDTMLEAVMDLKTLDNVPSPRILNTHAPFRHLPKAHLEKGYKVVHCLRNPKDVMVSWFNHTVIDRVTHRDTFPGTWDEYFQLCTDNKMSRYQRKKDVEMRSRGNVIDSVFQNVYDVFNYLLLAYIPTIRAFLCIEVDI